MAVMEATSLYARWLQAVVDRQLQRTIHPNWMANPDSWNWPVEEGHPPQQGWGRTWRDNPGLANLLWLVMSVDRPPAVWNARRSTRYMQVIAGSTGWLRPVVDLAALNSLEDFHRKASGHLLRKHDPLTENLVLHAKRRIDGSHHAR